MNKNRRVACRITIDNELEEVRNAIKPNSDFEVLLFVRNKEKYYRYTLFFQNHIGIDSSTVTVTGLCFNPGWS